MYAPRVRLFVMVDMISLMLNTDRSSVTVVLDRNFARYTGLLIFEVFIINALLGAACTQICQHGYATESIAETGVTDNEVDVINHVTDAHTTVDS